MDFITLTSGGNKTFVNLDNVCYMEELHPDHGTLIKFLNSKMNDKNYFLAEESLAEVQAKIYDLKQPTSLTYGFSAFEAQSNHSGANND